MSDEQDSFSDGEVSRLCQKALFVQPAPRSINMDTIPADGNEFVHKARLEASLLKFPSVNRIEESNTSAENCWKIRVANEFSRFAELLQTNRKLLKKKYSQKSVIPIENEIECCIFCLGSENCSEIYKCSPLEFSEAHLPLLNYLIHFNQSEISKLLKYSFKWYKGIGMDIDVCRWLFSFLACTNRSISTSHEEFLKDYFEHCGMYLKDCEYEDECRRVLVIMSLLEKYFSVKPNDPDVYFNHLF